ncbi:MAG TPA: radical SAM protein [Flavisolibacter sp.]
MRLRVRAHIFFTAVRAYYSISKAVRTLKAFIEFNRKLHGDRGNLKIIQAGRQYFFGLYAPGYPSRAFDDYIRGELNRIIPVKKKTNALSFIFFAITRKCPLQCEHCFEWNNLNKKETFALDELRQIVASFQLEGVSQFHFSGGEPMVRIRDLEELIRTAGKRTEFWILTSGFNLTAENARRLKQAGATGVVVSLDHYDADTHNAFRGMSTSFEWVRDGIRNALDQQLVVAATICATRSFVTWDNLMRYTELVKSMGVHFVQILEPKQAGRYAEKSVTLSLEQLELLERFYTTLNYEKEFRDYPVIIYHGYHQRRMGCMLAGKRNIYIDSAGDVNACPFCQTKNYNIRDRLHESRAALHASMSCPRY